MSYDLELKSFGSPIVGHVRTSAGADRAAVLSYGGYRELGTLGGAQSVALGASYGIVVGQSQTASGQFHAFLSDVGFSGNEQLVDLGDLWPGVTVRPIRVKTVTLSPSPATGGATVGGH